MCVYSAYFLQHFPAHPPTSANLLVPHPQVSFGVCPRKRRAAASKEGELAIKFTRGHATEIDAGELLESGGGTTLLAPLERVHGGVKHAVPGEIFQESKNKSFVFLKYE
jgi:hypothetical protein